MKKARKVWVALLAVLCTGILLTGCGFIKEEEPVAVETPTPTETPTPEPTEEPTPEPTETPTPTPTETPTPTPTETPTPTPTPTPEPKIPTITANPTSETVTEGESCLYIATADDADSMEWHFISPDGQTDVAFNAIASYFPTLGVEGGEGTNLTLSQIPLDFNDWKCYCRFISAAGHVDSTQVVTTVKKKDPSITPVPAGDNPYTGTYVEPIAGRGVVTITGDEDLYYVTITWPGSAFETADWTFSGEFDGRGVLRYYNCLKVVTTYEEDGIGYPQEEYRNGTGYIQMTDEGLIWSDDQSEGGEDAEFVKQ